LPRYAVLCFVAATILINVRVTSAQTALPAAADHTTFRVSSGILSVSPGLVQFDSSDKDLTKAEEKSWAASCDQITRWKASGSREVEIWIQRGNAKEFRASPSIRTDGKQEQSEIVDAIHATCGKAAGL
jgi:hypothetical protein